MPTPAARRDPESDPKSRDAAPRELLPAMLVVVSAWSLLASQAWLAPRIGRPAAVLLSFAAVTLLVLATRPRVLPRNFGRASALCALGALAGFVSLPAWIALIGALGVALGLPPISPPPRPEGLLLLVALLALAPVFEELLYRERLLLALRGRVGGGLAVVISSLCFALPHLEPWAMLATSCVGLALGGLMLTGRSVALCIGLHAGLNLAAVVCGIPPVRFALPTALALVGGAGLTGMAVLAAQRKLIGIDTGDGH